MFNLQTKFEVSTITCNEEMKGNAKCKNSHLSHSLGDLEVMHRVHLWLDTKRIVDFLLAIIELFSLALTAADMRNSIHCVARVCQRQRRLVKDRATYNTQKNKFKLGHDSQQSRTTIRNTGYAKANRES